MSYRPPPKPKGLGEQLMRADEYLMVLRLLDKPSPWMTSSEKSNRGEQNEEKEVTQRGVAQTPRKDPSSDAG